MEEPHDAILFARIPASSFVAPGIVERAFSTNVPVEHAVRISDFQKWLNREGGLPRERGDRSRIREILGAERLCVRQKPKGGPIADVD